MKSTNEPKKHTETSLIRFDTYRGLSQSEENKFMWHTVSIRAMRQFRKRVTMRRVGRRWEWRGRTWEIEWKLCVVNARTVSRG